ncbi:hypothetical protein RDV78_06100 [Bacillota bacterium LX-D]|nr:hypothetical protein [Bacillota bacterium LX-D]
MQHLSIAMESVGSDIRKASSISFSSELSKLVLNTKDGVITYRLENENIFGPSGVRGKQLWKNYANDPIASYLNSFNVKVENNFAKVKLTAIKPNGENVVLENMFFLRNK